MTGSADTHDKPWRRWLQNPSPWEAHDGAMAVGGAGAWRQRCWRNVRRARRRRPATAAEQASRRAAAASHSVPPANTQRPAIIDAAAMVTHCISCKAFRLGLCERADGSGNPLHCPRREHGQRCDGGDDPGPRQTAAHSSPPSMRNGLLQMSQRGGSSWQGFAWRRAAIVAG